MNYASEDAANRAAKRALKKMRTLGWRARVWENLGWHYCLHHLEGWLSVWELDGRYACMLSDQMPGSGSYLWDPCTWVKDPNRAVREQMKLARAYVDKVARFVNKIEQELVDGKIKN